MGQNNVYEYQINMGNVHVLEEAALLSAIDICINMYVGNGDVKHESIRLSGCS